MLAMCSVINVEHIKREQINADHIRLMDRSMTPEAKGLLLEASSLADEKMETMVLDAETETFAESGLATMTPEERILICRIYGSQGREIEITDEGMYISPSAKVLEKKRRMMKQQHV